MLQAVNNNITCTVRCDRDASVQVRAGDRVGINLDIIDLDLVDCLSAFGKVFQMRHDLPDSIVHIAWEHPLINVNGTDIRIQRVCRRIINELILGHLPLLLGLDDVIQNDCRLNIVVCAAATSRC